VQVDQGVAHGRLGDLLVEVGKLGAPSLVGRREALEDRAQLPLQGTDLASTSLRMASGSALKTSGLTTLPSCMGAMAKPVGVRSSAMFWACAFLPSASSASSLPERNCSSMARLRAW
jgi:hypothetical protein